MIKVLLRMRLANRKRQKRHLDWFRKNFGELQVDGILFQTDTEI